MTILLILWSKIQNFDQRPRPWVASQAHYNVSLQTISNLQNISFLSRNIITGSYRVDLEKVTEEQFNPVLKAQEVRSILAIDVDALPPGKNNQRFTWGLGPYITHRLFNPDLPLSLETGIEFKAGYQITPRPENFWSSAQISINKSY